MSYAIQAIELPKRTRTATRDPKYPFGDLEIGQCFVEMQVEDVKKVVARLTSAMNNYRKTVGEGAPRFTVRPFSDQDGNHVGVWRIEPKAPKA